MCKGRTKEDSGLVLPDDGDVLHEGDGALLDHHLLQDVRHRGVGEADLIPQPVQLALLSGTDEYRRPGRRDGDPHGVTQHQLGEQGVRDGEIGKESHLGVVGAAGQVLEGVLQLLPLQEAQGVGVVLGPGGQQAPEDTVGVRNRNGTQETESGVTRTCAGTCSTLWRSQSCSLHTEWPPAPVS